jgi:hypothetical protein
MIARDDTTFFLLLGVAFLFKKALAVSYIPLGTHCTLVMTLTCEYKVLPIAHKLWPSTVCYKIFNSRILRFEFKISVISDIF